MERRFDDARFFDAIDARRQAEKLSWRQLGRKLGLSASTFSRLARGRRPDVDTFLRLVGWLGLPAETFVKPGPASAKTGDQNTLEMIAAALRADEAIPPGGAGALEQLMRVAYAGVTAHQQRQAEDKSPPGSVRSRVGNNTGGRHG